MTNRISLNSFILGAALLSFSACSSDSPDGKDGGEGINALLDVVAVPVGDVCAEGGHTVNAGADTNANGVLDADEITSTSTMCNGEEGSDGDVGSDGLASLIEKTELPLDDENCPESGVRLDVGVDNGDGGGIADDGILQAGEVDDSTFVCSADNAIVAKPLTPPDSPVGAFTMNMNGGAASDGSGGDGGCFEVYMDPGTLTGHIKVFSTGVADASFDFPETIHTYLGSEPLVVDGDLTIESYATGDHSTMQAGQYHLHDGEALDVAALYKWTGTQDVKVTGVKVNAGATLTFAANQTDTSIFNIDNDFILAGTLTTELDGLNRIELKFYCDTYYGEEGSVIDLSGKDAPAEGTNGGQGGDFAIYADDQDQDFYEGWGSIFSHSDVDVSGGEGDNGGRGGSVKFAADLAIINSGDIFANGGTGLVGSGGGSQNIDFEAAFGHTFNSGSLNSNGGNGAVQGGNGNEIYLYIGFPGHIKNTGDLSANGGDVDAACTTGCQGGSGGDVYFYEYGGDTISSGNLSARGGFGAAGTGGAGGYIEISENSDNGWYGNIQPLGDLIISGDLDISGGDGADGGVGGYIEVYISGDPTGLGQEIIFLGYTDMLIAGGNGTVDGGDGGYLTMYQTKSALSESDSSYIEGPSGGLVNYAAVDIHGGNGLDGVGGDGGDFQMETEYSYGSLTDGEVALNYGDLNLSGGNGTTSGGRGGLVFLWGYNRVENHGAINGNGGECSVAECLAGSAQEDAISFLSDLGPVISSGDISVDGGDSTGTGYAGGGSGGSVEIVGYSVQLSGAISSSGGSVNMKNGSGGHADDIFVYGVYEGTSSTATYQVDPGDGFYAGVHGEVIIDGMNMTDSWYTE